MKHATEPSFLFSPSSCLTLACLTLTCLILLAPVVHTLAAEPKPASTTHPAEATTSAQDSQAPLQEASKDDTQAANKPPAMPHIRIDREKKWVDFDAKVVLRDGKWIELLVCTPGSREYESILTTEAKPSHLHLALLILGQTPGSPMTWLKNGDDLTPVPPKGPAIEVSIHYLKDGEPVVIPAGQWIINRQTNAPLPHSQWLFTGSKFMAVDGQPVYTADVNGSCLSLVNFGDELLARPTTQTNHTDNEQLAANTPLIPQVGTFVVVRLTPAEEAKAQKKAPTTHPAK